MDELSQSHYCATYCAGMKGRQRAEFSSCDHIENSSQVAEFSSCDHNRKFISGS